MSRTIRHSFIAAAFTAAALGIGSASDARACEPVCYWKTITVYVPVEQSYVDYVTKYDHCGRPYQAKVLVTETVRVPVIKRVRICG